MLIIITVAVVVLIIVLAFGLKKGDKSTPATLEFWSVYDGQDIYSELIAAYQKENEHITINYKKKSFAEYEDDLINALATGEGPDIFTIHNTWLPKHKGKISPIPQAEGFLTPKTFQDTFVDVVYEDFVDGDKIYAISFYVDTLALFYNKDLFNDAGIPFPPATWDIFLDNVELLTKKDKWGNIEQSGVAMGTAENINRSTDILALLMLQTGAEMTDKDYTKAMFDHAIYLEEELFSPGENALRFYTDFSNPIKRVYCWNRQKHYSLDAFYEGDVAMMINYSHHIDTIRNKAPYLKFAVAPVPQIKDRDFDINYANYWAQTVSKGSEHPEEAWKFIIWLAQKENVKDYLEKTKRPTSRRDLIEWQRDNPDLAIFADQALSARSWYQADNQAIEKIFANMVESIVLGVASIEQTIKQAAAQVTVLMR